MNIMPTLYVDRKNAEILHRDGRLRVIAGEDTSSEFPMLLLERVVLAAGCLVHASTLVELGRRGIPVAVQGSPRHARSVVLISATARDGFRRLAQVKTYLDSRRRLRLARMLVRSKLRRERLVLERERGGSREFAMRKGIEGVGAVLGHSGEWSSFPALMGAEGAAARAYFRAFRTLFAPALNFRNRNRRPPRDPVNACLSLGYSLLYSRLTGALAVEGFDPFIGYLHEPAAGRASLACDFVELQRTRIDAFVLRLFRDRTLRPEHFSTREGDCLLGKIGRRAFYSAWESEAAALDRDSVRSIRALARLLGAPQCAEGVVP